jgi:hypothetical protein
MTLRLFKPLRFGPVNMTVSDSAFSSSIGSRGFPVATRPGPRGIRQSYKLPGSGRLQKV